MCLRLLLLAAIILAAGFAPAPFPKRERATQLALHQRMQGWWTIVSERSDGHPGRNATSGLRLKVAGDSLQYFIRDQPADGWRITVDESTRPPSLDKMSPNSPKGASATYLCRISVEGDILKIGWISGNERPADLNGDRGVAITFQRERK